MHVILIIAVISMVLSSMFGAWGFIAGIVGCVGTMFLWDAIKSTSQKKIQERHQERAKRERLEKRLQRARIRRNSD
jgi:hypothetical protein